MWRDALQLDFQALQQSRLILTRGETPAGAVAFNQQQTQWFVILRTRSRIEGDEGPAFREHSNLFHFIAGRRT